MHIDSYDAFIAKRVIFSTAIAISTDNELKYDIILGKFAYVGAVQNTKLIV